MLEQVALDRELSKKEYKARVPALRSRLLTLQRACWESGLASLLVFEGWEASGKADVIRKLTERLEPRGFDLHDTVAPRTREKQLPWLGRFWVGLPSYGHMAIFNGSWYRRVLEQRVEGIVQEAEWRSAYQDIVSFERTLADDRYEIVKFFLHIDRDEEGRRLGNLEKDPWSAWRVDARKWDRHENYELYEEAIEEMLERTETQWAPWTIVEAMDKRWARIKVFETVIERLEDGLRRRGLEVPEEGTHEAGFEDADEESEDD